MSEYAFQFAVLRYVHDIVTQEFMNVGIVVYSPDARYVRAQLSQRYGRISKAFQGINGDYYRQLVGHIERRFAQLEKELRTERLPLWDDVPAQIEVLLARVVPPNDASLTFGGVGGGITDDLDAETERLYQRLVERYIERPERPSREDDEVWAVYRQQFDVYNLQTALQPVTIATPTYRYEFKRAWQNERWHPMEAVSFDLMHDTSIRDKATQWIGRAATLADSDKLGTLYLLLGAPPREDERLYAAYEDAKTNLQTKIPLTLEHRLVEESEAAEFSEELAAIIQRHERE